MEHKTTTTFGGHSVLIRTGVGKPISILDEIADPASFYGDPEVDHVVAFGDTFVPLVGEYNDAFGAWDVKSLPSQGVFILEYYYDEAARLVQQIDSLAQRLIADARMYDDVGLAQEYFELARAGYTLLRDHQTEFGLTLGTPLSLERGGLVATRLGWGLAKDARVPQEIRIVTKRVHPKGSESDLTVTVKWRDLSGLVALLDGQAIECIDFVNPASGASTAAALLAAEMHGAKPRSICHRAISSTKQGIMFGRRSFLERGIEPTFYSLGVCSILNQSYYLAEPGRAVGDAGHILRHNLPDWYEQ